LLQFVQKHNKLDLSPIPDKHPPTIPVPIGATSYALSESVEKVIGSLFTFRDIQASLASCSLLLKVNFNLPSHQLQLLIGETNSYTTLSLSPTA
jgi:hypothetical protein